MIKAVTGEEITAEELGGAKVHSQKSGVAHLVAASEQACFEQVKKLLELSSPPTTGRRPRGGLLPR